MIVSVRGRERFPAASVAPAVTRWRPGASLRPRTLAGSVSFGVPLGTLMVIVPSRRAVVHGLPRRAVARQRPPDRRPLPSRSILRVTVAASDSDARSVAARPVRARPLSLSGPSAGAVRSAASAGLAIGVVTPAALSAPVGSGSPDVARALSAIDPPAPARATIVAVTVAPRATVPRSQRTAVVHVPAEAVATVTSWEPAAVASRTVPGAASAPLFATRTMYVTSPPGATSGREAWTVTARSAPSSTAPMSQAVPAGAGAPRWSTQPSGQASAASRAGLPGFSAALSVGPPASRASRAGIGGRELARRQAAGRPRVDVAAR